MPRCAFLRTGAFLRCRERAQADMESAPTALKNRLVGRVLTPPRGVEDAAPYTDSMLVLGRFVGAGHAPPVCAVARARFTRRGGIHPSRAPASAENRHGRVKTLPYKLPGNVRLSKRRGPGMPGPYRSAINKNPGTPCVPGKLFSAYCSCAANSCGAAL